jgi:hypothetical protein
MGSFSLGVSWILLANRTQAKVNLEAVSRDSIEKPSLQPSMHDHSLGTDVMCTAGQKVSEARKLLLRAGINEQEKPIHDFSAQHWVFVD